MVHTNRATPSGYGQPVRFYKGVAITFLVLTIGLLAMIAFMSAKRADITIVTKPEAVDVSFVLPVGGSAEGAIAGTVSSTIISIEKSFTPKNTTTTAGAATGGSVTLYNDSNEPQQLIATTRLLSKTNVLYRIRNGVTVPAKGTVTAVVYPDKPGAESNLTPTEFTVPGLSVDRQKEVYAKNTANLSGTGERKVGVVTDEDVKMASTEISGMLKDQATTMAKQKFNSPTAAGYVIQMSVQPVEKVGDLVDSFVMKGKATVALADFKVEDVNKVAADMLNKKIVDNSEVLQTAAAAPTITFESYDSAKGTLSLRITHTGTVNLDPNGATLQKTVFFGKSEDEVRRYVMSLDHVEGVEFKFKPLWNHTVPQVADHVKLTLTQVE